MSDREEALDRLYWETRTYGGPKFPDIKTVADLEASWKKNSRGLGPWLKKGTRNHQELPDGTFRREERRSRDEYWDSLTINDEHADALARVVIGRTIVRFERCEGSGVDWQQGENDVTIVLDDGSELHFSGWGYDASGCDTRYTPPKVEP